LAALTDSDDEITTHTNNAITEEQVVQLFELLGSFSNLISEECSAAVHPFVCQYVYPPCDGNGSALLITMEQCLNVQNEMCVEEWRLVMNTEFGSLLPDCQELEDENSNSSLSNQTEPLQCHHNFKRFCGLCLPVCGMYSPSSDESNHVERIASIICGVFGLVGGVIVFIITIIRRKTK